MRRSPLGEWASGKKDELLAAASGVTKRNNARLLDLNDANQKLTRDDIEAMRLSGKVLPTPICQGGQKGRAWGEESEGALKRVLCQGGGRGLQWQRCFAVQGHAWQCKQGRQHMA
jgi:hypothetical protein